MKILYYIILLIFTGCASALHLPVAASGTPITTPYIESIKTEQFKNNYRIEFFYKKMSMASVDTDHDKMLVMIPSTSVFSGEAAKTLQSLNYPCKYTGIVKDKENFILSFLCEPSAFIYTDFTPDSMDIIVALSPK